jgi:hypothetical protein
MERIALILFTFWILPSPASDIDLRLNRELNFILGRDQNNTPPPTSKVFTYEDWKGDRGKTKMKTDQDGMIVDSTNTSLAAPVRDSRKVIINLNEDTESNDSSQFKTPRKRSR